MLFSLPLLNVVMDICLQREEAFTSVLRRSQISWKIYITFSLVTEREKCPMRKLKRFAGYRKTMTEAYSIQNEEEFRGMQICV